MKRKIVGILTASALLIGALAGCTSKPAETTVPKNLCEKMNLRITVSAETGTRTTFQIFFPKNTLVLLE